MRVTFDGLGLNDADDPYKARVATLTGKYLGAGKELSRAINTQEDIIAHALSVLDGYYTLCSRFNIEMKDPAVKALERVIAKAKGKSK